jgi:hypothetical protein
MIDYLACNLLDDMMVYGIWRESINLMTLNQEIIC